MGWEAMQRGSTVNQMEVKSRGSYSEKNLKSVMEHESLFDAATTTNPTSDTTNKTSLRGIVHTTEVNTTPTCAHNTDTRPALTPSWGDPDPPRPTPTHPVPPHRTARCCG